MFLQFLFISIFSFVTQIAMQHNSIVENEIVVNETIVENDYSHMQLCANDEIDESIDACFWNAKMQGNKQGQSFIWDGTNIIYVD